MAKELVLPVYRPPEFKPTGGYFGPDVFHLSPVYEFSITVKKGEGRVRATEIRDCLEKGGCVKLEYYTPAGLSESAPVVFVEEQDQLLQIAHTQDFVKVGVALSEDQVLALGETIETGEFGY